MPGRLHRARVLGVDFIDTADSYGPDVSENLIAEALHPYGDIRIATKAGLIRTGPSQWHPVGRPTSGSCTASTPRCPATSGSGC